MDDYELEDIRAFCVSRSWFSHRLGIISSMEYDGLKSRKLKIETERADRIRWFIKGYLRAKE